MRRAIHAGKFLIALGELVGEMVKWRSLPHRGSGPLWLIKRILAEWRFRQAEVDPFRMVAFLTGAASEDINKALDKMKFNNWLSEYCQSLMYLIQYLLVRLSKPETVVETGVAAGYSSATILQALEDNNFGQLYSIDLPPTGQRLSDGHIYSLPAGKQLGWAVPETLHHRWHLILGDSREKLPNLLQKLGKIDIFIHDSLHTERHMMFEYETAWPFIKQGGLLLSDDIGVSFIQFSHKVKRPYKCVISPTGRFGGASK